MQFYQPHTEFYCGVDPHTRNMYPTVLIRQSEVMCHRNIKNDPGRFLKARRQDTDLARRQDTDLAEVDWGILVVSIQSGKQFQALVGKALILTRGFFVPTLA
jgi:hypothetical protein